MRVGRVNGRGGRRREGGEEGGGGRGEREGGGGGECNSLVENEIGLVAFPLPACPTPKTVRVYCVSADSRGIVQSNCAPIGLLSTPLHSHWKWEGEEKLTIMCKMGGVPS